VHVHFQTGQEHQVKKPDCAEGLNETAFTDQTQGIGAKGNPGQDQPNEPRKPEPLKENGYQKNNRQGEPKGKNGIMDIKSVKPVNQRCTLLSVNPPRVYHINTGFDCI
jgi:hypothetical protein